MGELIGEVVHEITAYPLTFVAEVVQFIALVLIIKAIAFGFGKRKGVVSNMLAERIERIRSELSDAEAAEAARSSAAKEARSIVRQAKAESRQVGEVAAQSAEEERAAILESAQEEASAIVAQAEEVIARERAEALGTVRSQLVELVTAATRSVMNEGLSPAEQRTLIEKAVLDGLEDLDGVHVT